MRRWDVIASVCPEAKFGAEIGVFRGENAVNLLTLLPSLHLLLVDPYLAYDEEGMTDAFLEDAKQQMYTALQPYKSRAKWYGTSSREESQRWPDFTFDFVFIDANHSEKTVREDILFWKSKIKTGGYLIGHDRSWTGVKAAIASYPYTEYDDDVWGVRMTRGKKFS